MTLVTPLIGQLFRTPFSQPLSPDGKTLPGAYRVFYLTNSTTLENVTQDSAEATPYTQPVVAGLSGALAGKFSPIYLNPSIEYRSQLFNAAGQMLEDVDTVNNNTGGMQVVGLVGAGAPSGFARSAFKATTTTTTAGLINDPDLSVALPASGTYKIDMDLVMTAAASSTLANIELSFSGKLSAGAAPTNTYSLALMGTQHGVGAQSGLTSPFLILDLESAITIDTVAADNTMRYTGTIQVLTSGTLSFLFGSNGGTLVSLLAGSSLNVLQVA
jgi:hypothetical protein